jgi:Amt family ammonium transporter
MTMGRRLLLSLGIVMALGLGVFGTVAHPQETATPPTSAANTTATPATPASPLNAGDTAWMLASAALVMLMTAPGLALFYGGLVGHRNLLSTLMHSFFLLCLIGVQWVLFGYSLSFGSGGPIGGLQFLFFKGVGQDALAGQTVPHLAFAVYQGMFAVITPALISGAIAERMRFSAYVLFTLLWSTLVYDPLAHWVWASDGWLFKLPALDFAGGTVVHVSSGVSALVACLMLGKRIGYPQKAFLPNSVTLTLIGGGLLWFGWFGFNAGSALGASGLAAQAFVNTNTAAAVTGLAWACVEWVHRGKPTVLGSVTGAVAGLVAITPAAGYVTVPAALAIGVSCAAVCYFGVNTLKPKFRYDDALDVFGVHGLGGTWGAVATGIFATKAVNPGGADGLLAGNPGQLLNQLFGVAAAWVIAAVGTFVILSAVRLVTPLRVSQEDELSGLDLALHGEVASNTTPAGTMSMAESSHDSAAPVGRPSPVLGA